jgi:glycosyltransferase involved in cell wall biosynthesis
MGSRLVERGHCVTVYCRRHFVDPDLKEYQGIKLVSVPTVKNKYLDTLVHTGLSSLHALFRPYDVCLYFIAGNSPVSWIPRLGGKRTVLNVDGLDWKREKWPRPAKLYIRIAERLATILPTAALTDSKVVQRFYKKRYGARIHYIAYGSDVEQLPPGEHLRRWGLEPRKYVLFVGRIVPENHVDHLIPAFRGLTGAEGMKLVIMGDASYAGDYVEHVKSLAGEDSEATIFTGYIHGDGYQELLSNAYLFAEPSSASGTHPALLEAMACGNCVVAHDTPENRETVDGAGLLYPGEEGAEGLRAVLQRLIDDPAMVEQYRALASAHVRERYSWDAVTEAYLRLFYGLVGE